MKSFYLGIAICAILLISNNRNAHAQGVTPCASSYILISTDPATCPSVPGGNCTGSAAANIFRAKIRVYFAATIPIGTSTPVVTSALSGSTQLLNDFSFCVSGDQGSAITRTYVDYCVYGKNNSGPFPGGNLSMTFQSTGLLQSALCSVLNNIPCPSSFICINDPSNCTPCDANYSILTGKVRLFFPSSIPAGVPNPVITSVADASGTLNQFKLCASASAATNVERSYIDYCVYTNLAGSVLPNTAITFGLQLQSLSVLQCLVVANTVPCPSAFAEITNSTQCVPCDPNFPIITGTIRIFFPSTVPAGMPAPEVVSVANAGVTLNQFKLCALAGAGTNVDRTYIDYCVYSNTAGTLPNVPLTFTIKYSECAIPLVCLVTPVSPLPCINSTQVISVTSGAGGAGGTAAGCQDQSTCSGMIVYFASKLRVNFTPCLPAGFAAPTISSFTRTLANGTVIRYCLELSAASAALIGQQRCFVEYCVYSTLSGDTWFAGNPQPLPLNATYTVVINGNPTPLTQNFCTPSGAPLPVLFGFFIAERANDNYVNLRWETQTETNNRGFNVQRNTGNGWENVSFVASLAPAGNSNSPISYSYTDMNSYRGISQYRLQQVDLDGNGRYSEIRLVAGSGTNKVTIFPNPSPDGRINVLFPGSNMERNILVSDMAGRIIKQYKGVTGNHLIIEKLISGTYLLKIVDRNAIVSYEKFTVQ
jgi:hypothetical protein